MSKEWEKKNFCQKRVGVGKRGGYDQFHGPGGKPARRSFEVESCRGAPASVEKRGVRERQRKSIGDEWGKRKKRRRIIWKKRKVPRGARKSFVAKGKEKDGTRGGGKNRRGVKRTAPVPVSRQEGKEKKVLTCRAGKGRSDEREVGRKKSLRGGGNLTQEGERGKTLRLGGDDPALV